MATPVTPSQQATAAVATPKRQLRNFLLDARFQLKFTGYMVTAALAVALLLGAFLFRNTQALLRETEQAVEARAQAAETSRELSRATLTNQLVQHMDDPAFARQLELESRRIDAQYEQEHLAVVTQRADLLRRQKLAWAVLGGALLAFIVVIALATIVLTHKVVGPLFRLRRLVQEVADGSLQVPTHQLREGDELKDLFAAATQMVQRLRQTQEEDLSTLGRLARKAHAAGAPAEVVAELEAAAERIRTRLQEPRT